MTATYATPITGSGPVFFYDLKRQSPDTMSIDFVGRIRASSPSTTTIVEVKTLPDAINERYSFRAIYSLLDAVGQAAFENERASFDGRLRERFAQKEVSALYFYRCLSRMTQEELAARSGSRQSFLSQVEKRKRPLTWKQAKKFAEALGIEPARLMEA